MQNLLEKPFTIKKYDNTDLYLILFAKVGGPKSETLTNFM